VLQRVLESEAAARRVRGWRILWARRRAEVAVDWVAFVVRVGEGFSCWLSGDRSEGGG
jgi:hypothetical protein